MTSNGQLLALDPPARAKQIAGLPNDVRVRLARIAALGVRTEIGRGNRWLAENVPTFAESRFDHAADLGDLAAQLLEDLP
ncbi:hypothetical protein [Gordonia tangerina]|uniref:Uncharacterized protein n=1 Tax=Gordonia tangerina TaxID=2911060 RepID=A0ABS9DL21_9ACTN|nr:hypothetical protein [Gordonia tangerina]MCF3939934.1 hypothetical protein [Gordonia tangerina]